MTQYRVGYLPDPFDSGESTTDRREAEKALEFSQTMAPQYGLRAEAFVLQRQDEDGYWMQVRE